MIMGQLTILPKHYWTGKDANGNQRDPLKTTLEPPLGSGPYRIKQVTPGAHHRLRARRRLLGQGSAGQSRAVELRRDPLRLLPRRDGGVRELQGRQSRLSPGDRAPRTGRRPTTSPRCATAGSSARRCRSRARSRCSASCSICAVRNSRTAACGRPSTSPSTSNGRTRICSTDNMRGSAAIFQGSELAAPAALPQGRELEILNEVKDRVPPEVFTDGARQSGEQQHRRHARQSAQSRACS